MTAWCVRFFLALHHYVEPGEVYGSWGSVFKAAGPFLPCFLSLLKSGPNKGRDAIRSCNAKEFGLSS